MAATNPNAEWIGNVQPVGLVLAATVLARHGLNPAEQTRADSEAVRTLLSDGDQGPALPDPWKFFTQILGWRAAQVAGVPGGPALPADLSVRVEESNTDLTPHWAVADPDKGWQILVRIEGHGVDPEQRGALEGWEATPHHQLERLLRETGVSTGLLLTDGELRFVHAPRGETSGWLKFPLRSLGEVGGRPMLGGLKLILSSFRLHNDAPDRRLASLLRASREAQAEVSTRLAAQVLGALYELLRGLHSADRPRIEALAASRPDHVYEGLLTVLLRLVFLLYAEDRDLIPSRTDGEARALYDQGYGVRSLYTRLLDDAAHHPDTMDERRGAWSGLLALFRLVHSGDGRGWIRGRRGKLFDPDAFPFLQGQDNPSDKPAPATVSDGCVLRILDLLLSLDGEKLSYRTLDVEQIGSVYETVMGFTVETRTGPTLAIRAGKNDRTPVFVDVAALTAKKGSERAKFLKEEADRGSLTDKVGKPLAAAMDQAGIIAALRPIVDERASPGGYVAPPGTPLLQPTDERRRTGSHYTPRSLTGPIVQHALEPAFARIGDNALPEAVLDLKVCDPAMGSGAFLVEACRVLGERLVQAWARWPETRPTIPADEDEHLHARRLVAQRCLYGVDKNPLATDLAKLSLWLATLARDHEFTFLDHALKSGDSLVGLTQEQIAAAHWDTSKPGLPLFRRLVKERAVAVMKGRAEIQAAPDDTSRATQEQRHYSLEAHLRDIRVIGDAVIVAFFSEDKPKAREKKRAEIESWLTGSLEAARDKLAAMAMTLKQGAHPLTPFHWEIEFPEVFARKNGGFDAIVGNPPFLGGLRVSNQLGMSYFNYLTFTFPATGHTADLVAYFFRQSFVLLRSQGALGLLATNTVAQGDTRETGLQFITENGGAIFRAIRRIRWPGEAAVVVCAIHVIKAGSAQIELPTELNQKRVGRISSFLLASGANKRPSQLSTNSGLFSQGTNIRSPGFLFGNSGEPNTIADLELIQNKEPQSLGRIFPYLGGSEINSSPTQEGNRYVLNLSDVEKAEDLSNWPLLQKIVREKVKPERDALGSNPNNIPLKRKWWAYHAERRAFYAQVRQVGSILVNSQVGPHMAFARQAAGKIWGNTLNLFLLPRYSEFSAIQARPHEVWARFFGSSMKDDLRYTPSDCFETFPFPFNLETLTELEAIGETYHDHRAASMLARKEGMTKIYNKFHDPTETAEDIQRLRELHTAMDRAVLAAYGWPDLAKRAQPIFLDETNEDDHTYQDRLFWPSDFRDEVLARLLALNAERAGAEPISGVAKIPTNEDEAIDEEVYP